MRSRILLAPWIEMPDESSDEITALSLIASGDLSCTLSPMAQLIVRNLDDEIVRLLKARAAANGRSAEEEHRRILRAVLRSKGLAEHLRAMPAVGEDADFQRADDLPRGVEL